MVKRKYTFEDSAVVSDLKYWGYYKGRQLAADGYSIEDTLYALTVCDEKPEHQVLVRDMTPRAWRINGIVMALPTELMEALTGRFCLPVNPVTYQPYKPEEIAKALHIPVRTYQYRLTEGKRRYRRHVFGPDLVELQTQRA